MSYILDALRRAESERDRGQVPGLHAQPVPVDLGEGEKSGARRHGLMAASGAALALLLALAGWWWSRPDHAHAPAGPPSASAIDGIAPPARDAQPPAAGPPLLVAPPAPPPAPAVTAPPPARAATARAPAAARAASVADAAPPARVADRSVPPPTPAAAPGAVPAAGTPAAAPVPQPLSNRPTLLSDLPAAQRAELPQMLIGGAIYSDQPSSRFVVVNGLVVREGETAAPGVTLERIGPKSAVIRWREMRIELPI